MPAHDFSEIKILLFTSAGSDYLQDQIIIGLRELLGANLIDYPKKEVVYETCTISPSQMWGLGFTTSKILPDIPIDRDNVFERLRAGEFQYIIFSSIFRQTNEFWRLWKEIYFRRSRYRFGFLDGEDWARPYYPALFSAPYFKREQKHFKRIPWIHRIGFSIPSVKLRNTPIEKDRLFPTHVQCEEAYKIKYVSENCQRRYAFSEESSYYNDLARSKYGITMRKGGWDCMRHYEIAGNHSVPCFYRLNHKSEYCAPHGLADMENVIAFNTGDELQSKLDYIEKHDLYESMRENAYHWAQQNTCTAAAERLLQKLAKIYHVGSLDSSLL